jgi:hypothetical protein
MIISAMFYTENVKAERMAVIMMAGMDSDQSLSNRIQHSRNLLLSLLVEKNANYIIVWSFQR